VLAAAGLLAGGVGIALLFRQQPGPPVGMLSGSVAVVDVPLRRPDAAPEVSPPGLPSPAAPQPAREEATDVFDYTLRPDLAAAPLPELPGEFGPAGIGPRPSVRRDWKPARLKLPEARPKERRHRLTDGDTLERLAERYLGSPQRAGEIFDINRDLLPAPDLLPLGKVIRIPPPDHEAQRPTSSLSDGPPANPAG
jgi:nucleoid-associated protein YgaU